MGHTQHSTEKLRADFLISTVPSLLESALHMQLYGAFVGQRYKDGKLYFIFN